MSVSAGHQIREPTARKLLSPKLLCVRSTTTATMSGPMVFAEGEDEFTAEDGSMYEDREWSKLNDTTLYLNGIEQRYF